MFRKQTSTASLLNRLKKIVTIAATFASVMQGARSESNLANQGENHLVIVLPDHKLIPTYLQSLSGSHYYIETDNYAERAKSIPKHIIDDGVCGPMAKLQSMYGENYTLVNKWNDFDYTFASFYNKTGEQGNRTLEECIVKYIQQAYDGEDSDARERGLMLLGGMGAVAGLIALSAVGSSVYCGVQKARESIRNHYQARNGSSLFTNNRHQYHQIQNIENPPTNNLQ